MSKKLCKSCGHSKDLEEFYNDPFKSDGKKSKCKVCTSQYEKKVRSGEIIQKKTKRKVNYAVGTIQYEIYLHFSYMNVKLKPDDIKSIIEKLSSATKENMFYEEFNRLEELYGANKDNYSPDLLEEFRVDRMIRCAGRNFKRGGHRDKAKINQLTLDGELIKTFNSLRDASEAITGSRGAGVSPIANCALGRSKVSYGFIWEYQS